MNILDRFRTAAPILGVSRDVLRRRETEEMLQSARTGGSQGHDSVALLRKQEASCS